jgi:hypothetical protein
MLAILQACHLLLRKLHSGSIEKGSGVIQICSDNKGAVQALLGRTPKINREWFTQFREIMFELHEKFDLSFIFVWTPGHSGIPGNEHVDTLAKEACGLPSRVRSTTSYNKMCKESIIMDDWKKLHVDKRLGQRGWLYRRLSIKTKKTFKLPDFPKEVLSRYIQVITGHSFNGTYTRRFHHSKIMAGTATDLCRSCKVLDDEFHIMNQCPDFEPWRSILRKEDPRYSIKSLAQSEDGQKALLTFLQRSGAFSFERTKFVPHLDRLMIPDFERYDFPYLNPNLPDPPPEPPDPP